jgi:uncharacterized protein
MRQLNRVRKISRADKQLLLKLKHIVTRLAPDAQSVLYGSAARGTRAPDSDYDVVVVTSQRLSSDEERRLDRAVYDLQLQEGIVLSVMIYSHEEWQHPLMGSSPYRKNVLREGILL